jgi:hypothetical protein
MDVLLKEFPQNLNVTSAITTLDLVLALVSSGVLSTILSWVYIKTHSG